MKGGRKIIRIRGRKEYKEQSFGYGRAVAHKNSAVMTANTRPAQAQYRPNVSMQRDSPHEVPLLAKELYAVGSCWEKRVRFLQECYL